MSADLPTTPMQPLTMRNETQPSWGVGLVVQDIPPYWVLFFEHAGEKKFIKEKVKGLIPVKLSPEDLAALQTRATGRKPKAAPKRSAGLFPARKPLARTKAAPRFATFKEQLALFERLFIGGFGGEAFLQEERGLPGVTGKAGYKEAGIALAQEALSPAAFATGSPDQLFKSAQQVLGLTNIAFPIEGPIPFGQLEGDDRVKAMAALKDLLHGAGDYADRLERFAGALNLKDGKGEGRRVTWPLATVFGGLYAPKQFTCVKPTAFAGQAATLGIAVEKTQPLNAEGYRKFLEVATRTQALLLEAGHQPRDLIDVYTFIWRTHAQKPAVVEPG